MDAIANYENGSFSILSKGKFGVYGNDGTRNGPRSTEGPVGDALVFDERDDHVVVPDFDYGSEFTVAFWFKSSGNEGTVVQHMFSHAATNASNSLNIYFVENAQPLALDHPDGLSSRVPCRSGGRQEGDPGDEGAACDEQGRTGSDRAEGLQIQYGRPVWG